MIVSNHGGRQLDSVVPTVVALEEIAAEVGDDCTVLVDGGIRSGVDVVKALALGADAVCIGRPYLWGLALAGDAGVLAVLDLLRRELEDALQQLGVGSIAEIGSRAPGRDPLDADARPDAGGPLMSTLSDAAVVHFSRGIPPLEAIPSEELADHTAAVLEERRDEVFQYAPIGRHRGDPALRAQLGAFHDVDPERIFVGNGSLQVLDLVAGAAAAPTAAT